MKFIHGQVLGVKTVQRQGQNGPYEQHYVGFQAPKPGGFEGEMETVEVQLSKRQVETGVMATYERVKGQQVVAPFFDIAYVSKAGNVGSNYMLAGDGKPVSQGK